MYSTIKELYTLDICRRCCFNCRHVQKPTTISPTWRVCTRESCSRIFRKLWEYLCSGANIRTVMGSQPQRKWLMNAVTRIYEPLPVRQYAAWQDQSRCWEHDRSSPILQATSNSTSTFNSAKHGNLLPTAHWWYSCFKIQDAARITLHGMCLKNPDNLLTSVENDGQKWPASHCSDQQSSQWRSHKPPTSFSNIQPGSCEINPTWHPN